MSAQDIFRETPEIFELILLALPTRFLLTTAPLVCRFWRDTIRESPAIQQKLFFRQAAERTPTGEDAAFQVNPLLKELFPSFFESGCVFRPIYEDKPWTDTSPPPLHHVQNWDRLALNRRPDAFLRHGASWRRMLVQQPPMPAVGLFRIMRTRHCLAPDTWRYNRRYARSDGESGDGGLRMGQLYDLIFARLASGRSWLVWGPWPPPEHVPVPDPPEPDLVLGSSSERVYEVLGQIEQMLHKAPVVLVSHIWHRPMNPILELPGWKEKFKSADFRQVRLVYNPEEPDYDDPPPNPDD